MTTPQNGKGSVQGRFNYPNPDDAPIGIGTGIGAFNYPLLLAMSQANMGILNWSPFPAARDRQLRDLARKEPVIASAVYAMQAKVQALSFQIMGKGTRAKKYYADLLGKADDEGGSAQLFGKTVYDLLTTDNGAFWELHAPGAKDKPRKSAVQAIYHLDSNQCYRTLDPEFPVVYVNPYFGTWHKLHRSRVVTMTNGVHPSEISRNIGFCAVSRALLATQIMYDIMTYKHEKVSGKFTRALLLLRGVNHKTFAQAVEAAEQVDDSRGFTRYKGIPTLFNIDNEMAGQLLDFASIPDGFDEEKSVATYVYIVAMAFGVDARELYPATVAGATRADATIQHLKAQGKGIGNILMTIERAINWHVIGEEVGVKFEFDRTDDEQDKLKEEIKALSIANTSALIAAGMITPVEGRAIAIANGVIDPDVLSAATAPINATDAAPVTEADLEKTIVESPDIKPMGQLAGNQATVAGNPEGMARQAMSEDMDSEDDAEEEDDMAENEGEDAQEENKKPKRAKKQAPPIEPPKGKPLPKRQALAVKPFSQQEIDSLFKEWNDIVGSE